MPNQPFKIIVWINAEARHYLSEAGLGLALVRGQCDGGQKTLVCDVIDVADVLVSITITFESAFGIFAAPPSAAPITSFKVVRPVLRQVAQPGWIFQFDGTQFTALRNAPSDDMIGITYQPLAPTAQRIVVGLTEMVRQEERGGAWPPIKAVVLGAGETAFFRLPDPFAYIFTESGMSVGLVLGCNLVLSSTPLAYRTATIVMGRPLALPLSESQPTEVHFDVRSNTLVRGPYPATLAAASTTVGGRCIRCNAACGD